MGVTAVICEYNPFHSGHERQIRYIKETRPDDAVVCIMSSYFCQRGEAAVFTPKARAECALAAGADVVLGLSAADVLKDASGFADSGVCAAAAIGADTLCFGSESGNMSKIVEAANAQEGDGFNEKLERMMKSDVTRSRASFVSELSGELGSNDILGIEYVKSIKKHGFAINPETIKREGGYLADGSAFAIRNALLGGKEPGGMPDYAEKIVKREMKEGRVFSLGYAERAVLAGLRTADIDSLTGYYALNRELSGILIKSAAQARSLRELLEIGARKKYSASRLRRAVLAIMLRIPAKRSVQHPAYLTLIGLSKAFSDGFSVLKKKSGICIASRASEAKAADMPAFEAENRAASFYALCGGTVNTAREYITQKPVVI